MLTLMKSWLLAFSLTPIAALAGSDWNQWRGPDRNGVLPDSPPLVNAVPAVVEAKAGLLTALDLHLITGKGLVRT